MDLGSRPGTVIDVYDSFLSTEKVVGLIGLPTEEEYNDTLDILDKSLSGYKYSLSSLRFKRLVLLVSSDERDAVRAILNNLFSSSVASPYFCSFVLRSSLSAEKVKL